MLSEMQMLRRALGVQSHEDVVAGGGGKAPQPPDSGGGTDGYFAFGEDPFDDAGWNVDETGVTAPPVAYDAPTETYDRYDPATDTYYGYERNFAWGNGSKQPISMKGSEASQGFKDAWGTYGTPVKGPWTGTDRLSRAEVPRDSYTQNVTSRGDGGLGGLDPSNTMSKEAKDVLDSIPTGGRPGTLAIACTRNAGDGGRWWLQPGAGTGVGAARG